MQTHSVVDNKTEINGVIET